MSVDLSMFIKILIVGSAVSTLLTQAVKKAYENAGKEYSANVLALIDAIVVGCGGTAVYYMLHAIPWTVNNVICLFLMGIAVWIGSMIGYDKILQLFEQLGVLPVKTKEKEAVDDGDEHND